ncbi:MAG: hypothetical protein AAFR84_01070 [Pseudomonadota bacterium]
MAALGREELRRRVEAFEEHGGIRPAARALGIHPSSLSESLARAARLGIGGDSPIEADEGFEITHRKVQLGSDGEIKGQSVSMRQEAGEVFELPPDCTIEKTTYTLDAENRILKSWPRVYKGARRESEIIKHVERLVSAHPPAPAIRPPEAVMGDLANIVPRADMHIGSYSNKAETGYDWTPEIAKKKIGEATAALFAMMPQARVAVILGLGDALHANDNGNRTQSGHSLDVQGRHHEAIDILLEMEIATIDLALRTHSEVVYHAKRGNHDRDSYRILNSTVRAHYRNEPRVTVDSSPAEVWYWQHGRCAVSATHGDTVPQNRLAACMSNERPDLWAACPWRFAFTGHLHHERQRWIDGLRAFQLFSPAAPDAWAKGNGYISFQLMSAVTLHRDRGLLTIHESPV